MKGGRGCSPGLTCGKQSIVPPPCPLRVDRNSVIIVARSLSLSLPLSTFLSLCRSVSLPLQLHRDFHFRFNWKYVKMFPFFSCAFKEGVRLGAAAACVWFVTSPTPSPFHSTPPTPLVQLVFSYFPKNSAAAFGACGCHVCQMCSRRRSPLRTLCLIS